MFFNEWASLQLLTEVCYNTVTLALTTATGLASACVCSTSNATLRRRLHGRLLPARSLSDLLVRGPPAAGRGGAGGGGLPP